MTTREHILDTSISLFAEHGYAGTSIRDIAAAVGIKESSIYNHFAGKADILGAVYENFRATMQTAVPPPIDPAELGRSLVLGERSRAYIAMMKELLRQPRTVAIIKILSQEQYRDPRARELILEGIIEGPRRHTQALFERLVSDQTAPGTDAVVLGIAAHYPVSMLFLEIVLRRSGGLDTAEAEENLDRYADFFWQSVIKQGVVP